MGLIQRKVNWVSLMQGSFSIQYSVQPPDSSSILSIWESFKIVWVGYGGLNCGGGHIGHIVAMTIGIQII